ncbi:hypothetical protein ELI24_17465 [Rhizobium ruizarguesonis]|uniref:hypothetical protein n=1 Tax=Rhizobium ruizarguesonis TaxID=2081791 RepID=UPI0010323EC0|nr:hypothetical protein [Rhizobium ruizarguesonis]TAW00050.1 hypothetical protein ELI24_17465 [Rhizobium ruizarguesonis]TAW17383.1 hypothetical protein ELI25_16910 [Rhizobium ruizarguesonis]TAZ52909.1 hypothetical protein ELH76_17915 [Rhizobium ruizarguesonis]
MLISSKGIRPLFVCLVAAGSAADPALADLLIPDWNAAAAKAFLARDRAAEPGGTGSGGGVERALSLPVIGFFPGFNAAQLPPDDRDRLINQTDTAALDWPSCAVTPSAPQPIVRDDSGTWFTQDYDFGCVHVSVNGDRNTDNSDANRARIPDGDGVGSVDDETDSGTAGSLTIRVNRFGLPYLVSIECYDEIKALCQPDGPWQSLINRLSIVGGTP